MGCTRPPSTAQRNDGAEGYLWPGAPKQKKETPELDPKKKQQSVKVHAWALGAGRGRAQEAAFGRLRWPASHLALAATYRLATQSGLPASSVLMFLNGMVATVAAAPLVDIMNTACDVLPRGLAHTCDAVVADRRMPARVAPHEAARWHRRLGSGGQRAGWRRAWQQRAARRMRRQHGARGTRHLGGRPTSG